MINKLNELHVILKVTERCNIDCTYCYVFHKGDTSYLRHPPKFRDKHLEKLASFINEGISTLSITKISITLHGGEPLLLGIERFQRILKYLQQNIQTEDLSFIVQTNGILINNDWVDLFEQFNVTVGVSIDGNKEANDEYRVDPSGKGTYDDVVKGIKLLKVAEEQERIPLVGALCVINPNFNGGDMYKHLVHDLGFTFIDFNLPMDTHETFNYDIAPEKYGNFLVEVLNEWKTEISSINIRKLMHMMTSFSSQKKVVQWEEGTQGSQQICVSTDGHLGMDEFKPVPILHDAHNIHEHSLKEFIDSEYNKLFHIPFTTIPSGCKDCVWKNYCKGGALYGVFVGRYSEENHFNNKSVICEAYKTIFSNIVKLLIEDGVKVDNIMNSLNNCQEKGIQLNDSPFPKYLDKENNRIEIVQI
jgi:uncharacterized protein